MRAPGAMPMSWATAASCATRPMAREPDGPTQNDTGTGEAWIRSANSTIRSSVTTAPALSTWKTTASVSVGSTLRRVSAISRTTISSRRPLISTTSTPGPAGS